MILVYRLYTVHKVTHIIIMKNAHAMISTYIPTVLVMTLVYVQTSSQHHPW